MNRNIQEGHVADRETGGSNQLGKDPRQDEVCVKESGSAAARFSPGIRAPMRILVLSVFFPLPANNGVRMRIWGILRNLAGEGHRVHLLCLDRDREAAKHAGMLAGICEEAKFVGGFGQRLGPLGKHVRRVAGLMSRLPACASCIRSRAMRLEVRRRIKTQSFDLILLEDPALAINLPSDYTVPVLIDFHNVDHIHYQRYADCIGKGLRRYFAAREAAKLLQWERLVTSKAAAAMACSAFDRVQLQRLSPSLPIMIAPNVVDPEQYHPNAAEEPFTLLYQGGMDWYPNQDAADYFVTSIFPLIRARAPKAKVMIAGRNPPRSFRERLQKIPGVILTGSCPDLRSVMDRATLSVVPLRIASGTRLKILEAAAMQKAIVSTSVGAEGLEFRNGLEILLADTPAEFAKAVLELLQNPERRHAMGRAARHRVEQSYNLQVLGSAVRQAVELARFGSQKSGARPIENLEPSDARYSSRQHPTEANRVSDKVGEEAGFSKVEAGGDRNNSVSMEP